MSTNGKYRIPANNPYVDDPNALSAIHASGIRSPYRFSIDTQTGLLFLGDVGQASREEVDVVRAGDNLGWPYLEGTAPFFSLPNPPPEMVGPIAEYTHADGVSIIGGYVYRGSIPALQGKYIFGELSYGPNGRLDNQGRLFWIDPYDEAGEVKDLSENRIHEIAVGPSSCAESYNSPGDCAIDGVVNSFAVDDDGELYVIGLRNSRTLVYKITDAYFLPDGDYNQDGVVDAADYTVWRNTLGSTTDLVPMVMTPVRATRSLISLTMKFGNQTSAHLLIRGVRRPCRFLVRTRACICFCLWPALLAQGRDSTNCSQHPHREREHQYIGACD